MNIDEKLLRELKTLRRTIHQYPEVSGEEHETRDLILDFVRPTDPDEIYMIAETGLAVVFNGKKPGPAVLFRAELDALPIQEENDFSYTSRNEGVAHNCGHDGHMTILAGMAQLYGETRPEKGRVILLFQPSEEDGRGARAILNDNKFSKIEPDYVFALHNLPGYPMHQVACKEGTFSAAAESIIFRLKGKTSHAAEPEKGANPAYAISEVLEQSKSLIQPDPEKEDFSLVTPVYIHVGEKAYGVSAGDGDLRVTLRSFSNEVMSSLKEQLISSMEKSCKKRDIKLETDFTESFAANINDKESYTFIKKAAENTDTDYHDLKQPFKWGEDFGFFTDQYPGAMFGLGSGKEQPALHNPDYDFPDELTKTGMNMFFEISNQILN